MKKLVLDLFRSVRESVRDLKPLIMVV